MKSNAPRSVKFFSRAGHGFRPSIARISSPKAISPVEDGFHRKKHLLEKQVLFSAPTGEVERFARAKGAQACRRVVAQAMTRSKKRTGAAFLRQSRMVLPKYLLDFVPNLAAKRRHSAAESELSGRERKARPPLPPFFATRRAGSTGDGSPKSGALLCNAPLFGDPPESRTPDTMIKSHVLCHLS